MTPYGFTEGALNTFFTQPGVCDRIQQAGYISGTVTSILATIAAHGVAGLESIQQRETSQILKFIVDHFQAEIEECSGDDRTAMAAQSGVDVNTLTNGQIVGFFVQPTIMEVLRQRYETVTPLMRIVVLSIQSEGADGVARYRHVNSNMHQLISDFYGEIVAYTKLRTLQPSQDRSSLPVATPTEQMKNIFAIKLQNFRDRLEAAGYKSQAQKMLAVNRLSLLHDAYEEVMMCSARDLKKKKVAITFCEEEGLDYGGPSREFYFFVSRDLFNPYYGLFEYSSVGSYTIQISSNSLDIPDALQWFRFAGRFIGMAVVQGYLVDVFFARHFYKALISKPYGIEDLQVIDLEFYNSLCYVLDNDPEPLALTFSIEGQFFGEIKEHELIKGGSNIAVVESNKELYIDLMVNYRLGKGITSQLEAFVKGFREIIPPTALNFEPYELEWLIAGQAQIDVTDWKANTVYWGHSESSDVIKWFWQAISEYSNEQRLRLLQFVTGTSSIPLEGFKGLRGSDGAYQSFTIDAEYSDNGDNVFPRAHTCFNRIDLPIYSSYQVLMERLTRAIEETEAFGDA